MKDYPSKIRKRTMRNGKVKSERVYLLPCPTCRNDSRWLTKGDALIALKNKSVCHRCSSRLKGKKGFQASLGTYDQKLNAMHKFADYLRTHMSKLEIQIANELTQARIPHYPQAVITKGKKIWIVDFKIGSQDVLEIQGAWHRIDPNRKYIDQRKKANLESWGFIVHTITDCQIETGNYCLPKPKDK